MNLFGGELPSEVNINGKIYPFSTDFYDWMRFETLMLDADIPDSIKTDIAVKMLFDEPPQITEDLPRFLLWFWRCGKTPPSRRRRDRGSGASPSPFRHLRTLKQR